MIGELVKAGTKAMGGAQFSLLSVLPGALVVTVTGVLIGAGAYDFDRPVDIRSVAPTNFDTSTVVAFALAALVGGILLRPFERALVQQLEGYWSSPSPLAPLQGAAIERHRRRRDDAGARVDANDGKPVKFPEGPSTLRRLAALDRQASRRTRALARDRQIVLSYHDDLDRDTGRKLDESELMPTLLGNVLRRSERMAGGRYGLDAMAVYPRIYPYISDRLAEAMARQLDLLTATASLSISFGMLSAVTLPLVARFDPWSLTPVAAAVLAVLAYRGAVVTAHYAGELLNTVFDLHRFDLATAFHYELPPNAEDEYDLNEDLTGFLKFRETHTLKDMPLGYRDFSHPTPAPPTPQSPTPPAGGGSE
ncbi:hypothetical protein [Streptomyces sp. NPDC096132]|uniref:hypothetical protein n=1 Tax=Streptomyces sp. NPDC096132 TaxID=3366075 RepID=UPI003819C32B